MIPRFVQYTGCDPIDPKKIIARKLDAPMPLAWTRHQFDTAKGYNDPSLKIGEWIENNLHHRYSIHATPTSDGFIVVIGFENATDAVMFRMMDGETSWVESTAKFL